MREGREGEGRGNERGERGRMEGEQGRGGCMQSYTQKVKLVNTFEYT